MSYPYTSSVGGIYAAIQQLRKGFPATVDAGYLQRFSIAKSNESYIITILKFLGFIDEEGNQRSENTEYFFLGDDAFEKGFDAAVRKAYKQLFDEMREDALTADRSVLTNWFRASDKTSDLVGGRQASTFQALCALAGHADVPKIAPAKKAANAATAPAKKTAAKKATTQQTKPPKNDVKIQNPSDVGVTVRIEVNLPPGGDAKTYDDIFASIKKHLMS